jgi:hypothetical protein
VQGDTVRESGVKCVVPPDEVLYLGASNFI